MAIKRLIKLAAVSTASAYIAFYSVVTPLTFKAARESVQITSQQQLEQLLETEKNKLNCEKDIIAILDDSINGGGSYRGFDGKYYIKLGGDRGANLSVLKHEIYHIHDGHSDNILSKDPLIHPFIYYLWNEPQAVIYQIFGIKL